MTHTIPNPIPLPDHIPFAQARELSIDIPVEACGKTYVYYVDDFITIGPDNDDLLERVTKAPVTVIHAIADNSINSNSIPEEQNEGRGSSRRTKDLLRLDVRH